MNLMAVDLDGQDDEAFLRTLIRCEEDRRRLYPHIVWVDGYRWFKSSNVIDLERARVLRTSSNIASYRGPGRP